MRPLAGCSAVLLAGLLAGLPVSSPVRAAEQAETWLQLLAVSLTRENYVGIVSYLRGDRLESIELVHSYQDGEERDRITFLTGPAREIIRRGDQTTVYTENNQVLSPELPLASICRTFSENMQVYRPHYEVRLTGAGRVAGRRTVEIDIKPRQADRYGYHLSVDQATGLLLGSAMYEPSSGRKVETVQFATIDFPAGISDARLKPTLGLPGAVSDAVARRPVKPTWQVGYLPGGFIPADPRHAPVSGAMFTDGLASLSIFVEAADPSLPDLETRMGGTVVLTRRLAGGGQQVTLVGEIPVTVARQIAASVRQ